MTDQNADTRLVYPSGPVIATITGQAPGQAAGQPPCLADLRWSPSRLGKGYTYLEILVALGLLMVLLVPLVMLSEGNVQGLRRNRKKMVNHLATLELVEQILSLPYDDVPVGEFDDRQLKNGALIPGPAGWKWRLSPSADLMRGLKVTEDQSKGWKTIRVKVAQRALDGRVYTLPEFVAVMVREVP